MKRISLIAAACVCVSAVQALAAPHGTWPDQARARPMPRPAWVLVVPAMRLDDGSIKVWSRADDWPQEWVVPKATSSGLRTVAISGDSEDQKLILPQELDNMRMDSLRRMAGKYGAEAVAVAVVDVSGNVAVAAWARGSEATWDEASGEGDPRGAALRLVDGLFGGDTERPATETDDAAVASPFDGRVYVVGERQDPSGGPMEYRIEIPDGEADVLRNAVDLTVTRTGGGTTDVTVAGGRSLLDVLAELGLETRFGWRSE